MVIFDAGYEPARLAWLLRIFPSGAGAAGHQPGAAAGAAAPPARPDGPPVRHGGELKLFR